MNIEYTRGFGSRFCWVYWKKAIDVDGKQIDASFEDLEEEAKKYAKTTKILAKISQEKAWKWRRWPLGELYAVVYFDRLVFCSSEGYVLSISE